MKPDVSWYVQSKLELFYARFANSSGRTIAYLDTFLPVFDRRDAMSRARFHLVDLLSDPLRKNGATLEAAVSGALFHPHHGAVAGLSLRVPATKSLSLRWRGCLCGGSMQRDLYSAHLGPGS